MKKLLTILFTLLFTISIVGCATTQEDYSKYSKHYENKIELWQNMLKNEGWNEKSVDTIMKESKNFMDYSPDVMNEWLTPQGIKNAGFRGDCEDIAVCMWNSLKQLDYPYAVRIRIVDSINSHHAIVVVQLPDKTWKEYNTTNCVYYDPIIEFDEEHYWELWADNEDRQTKRNVR